MTLVWLLIFGGQVEHGMKCYGRLDVCWACVRLGLARHHVNWNINQLCGLSCRQGHHLHFFQLVEPRCGRIGNCNRPGGDSTPTSIAGPAWSQESWTYGTMAAKLVLSNRCCGQRPGSRAACPGRAGTQLHFLCVEVTGLLKDGFELVLSPGAGQLLRLRGEGDGVGLVGGRGPGLQAGRPVGRPGLPAGLSAGLPG